MKRRIEELQILLAPIHDLEIRQNDFLRQKDEDRAVIKLMTKAQQIYRRTASLDEFCSEMEKIGIFYVR